MRIVVIAGPPCAGKTTLARRLAKPGDAVIDFDDIARSLGSPALWLHPEPWRTQAERALLLSAAQCRRAEQDGTAYLLRTAPKPASRASMAAQWDAAVYVLDPGMSTCLARAQTRPAGTARAVRSWYFEHRRWHGDRDAVDLMIMQRDE